jgi:hypothetical protein
MHLNVIDDLANLIFVGAYWVKDILWLRLMAIVGSLVVIPYGSDRLRLQPRSLHHHTRRAGRQVHHPTRYR